jgi:hypothetical protein
MEEGRPGGEDGAAGGRRGMAMGTLGLSVAGEEKQWESTVKVSAPPILSLLHSSHG